MELLAQSDKVQNAQPRAQVEAQGGFPNVPGRLGVSASGSSSGSGGGGKRSTQMQASPCFRREYICYYRSH